MRRSTLQKQLANRSSIFFAIRRTKSSRPICVAGEEEEIDKRYKLASNSKRLIELASAVANKLSEADDSVLSQLAETQRLLRELEKIDNSIAQFSSGHAASVVELSEIARALSTYAEKLDLDPEQLAALEQRVSLFETLKRKYGGSIADVLAFGERAAERMQKIEGRDAELERLGKEIENVRAQMNRAGEALRKLRTKAAPKLSETIRRNLRDLGFRQSEFEAKLDALDEPRLNGFDVGGITFLAESRRTVKAASRHRIERRNLTPDAGDQIRAGRARRDSPARVRRDRHECRRRDCACGWRKDADAGPRSSAGLYHASSASGCDRLFAFCGDKGSGPGPNLFAITRDQRERTSGRDRAHAWRQKRIGIEISSQLVGKIEVMLKQICISFAFPMFALAQAPYASERPMAKPTIFGKGIISGGDFDSHPAFTPDGRTIYFVRSAPNFSFWTIFVSRFENGHWTPPEVAPFSGQYSDADPFITADGKQFYFLSKRPVNGRAKSDNDIWVMNKTETGWSEPRHLDAPVNSDGDEWYPTLTRDGTIYFGSDRAGGHGKTDLYRARLVDGKYATAENLGEPVSTAADEYEPFIAPDESSLIFMAAGRSDSLGRGDLYVSYRRGEKWSVPQNLGKKINSNGTEYSPKISPDGKYFFWSSTRGLTDAPMEKRLDTTAMLEKFRSAGNGLGDIYQIDLSELRLEGKIDK